MIMRLPLIINKTFLTEMSDDKPNVMWMVLFNIESICETKTSFENLVLVPGPNLELDCDSSISMVTITLIDVH